MRIINLLASASMALALSSCALFSGTEDLGTFTSNDLTLAKQKADAAGDTDASACYAALIPVVKDAETAVTSATTTATSGADVGAFTAFQMARTAKQSVSGAGTVGKACAPLVTQVKADAAGLSSLLGGVSFPIPLP